MNSGFSVVVVVVAISKMMLIVVVDIFFLERSCHCHVFVSSIYSFLSSCYSCCCCLVRSFLLFLRLPAFHRLLRLDGASVGDDW